MKKTVKNTSVLLKCLVKNNLKRFLAMVFTSMLGITTMITCMGSYNAMFDAIYDFTDKTDYPDVLITLEGMFPVAAMEDMEDISGVSDVDYRKIVETTLIREDGHILGARLFSYGRGQMIKPWVYSGEISEDAVNADFLMPFADANDIKPGDRLTLSIGPMEMEIRVGRIVSEPDGLGYAWSLGPVGIRYNLVDYGYIFMEEEDIDTFTGLSGMTNQVMVVLEDGAAPADVVSEAEQWLEKNNIPFLDITIVRDLPIFHGDDDVLSSGKILSYVLSPLFFLVMILVIYMLMSQLIGQSREKMAVLRAIGYSVGRLYRLFFVYGLLVTLLAVVIGIVLGIIGMQFLSGIYVTLLAVPMSEISVSIPIILLASAITIVTGLLSVWISARRLAKIDPAIALRGRYVSQEIPRQIFPQFIIKRVSTQQKMVLSSISRNRQRFLLSVCCIGFCCMMSVTMLYFLGSKKIAVNQLFEDCLTYDCEIVFEGGVPDAVLDKLSASGLVEDMETGGFTRSVCTFGDNTEGDVWIYTANTGSTLYKTPDKNGAAMEIPDEGLIMGYAWGKALGVKAGDTVDVDGQPVVVAGIASGYFFGDTVCSVEQMTRLAGTDAINRIRCSLAQGASFNDVVLLLKDEAGYHTAVRKSSVENGITGTYQVFDVIVWVLIFAAGMMNLLVIYNLSLNQVEERSREYSCLRVLGYQVRGIALNSLTEVLLKCILGGVAGSLLGTAAGGILLKESSIKNLTFPFVPAFWIYGIACGVILVFSVIGHLCAIRCVRRMDLTEVLKSRE